MSEWLKALGGEKKLAAMYESGMAVSAISEQAGVSRQWISKTLSDMGVAMRRPGKRDYKTVINYRLLQSGHTPESFLEEHGHLSYGQQAEILGVCEFSIRQYWQSV